MRDLPSPPRHMVRLPRNPAGYPIVWFAADGTPDPDFRLIPPGKVEYAIRNRRCWICGLEVSRSATFVIGPMCAVNRTSSEPPSHHDCATYAAMACPFLATPERPRRTSGMEGTVPLAGTSINRNPGVVLLWTSRTYGHYAARGGGVLFDIGTPERVEWYCRGVSATRAEVQASIDSGLPVLEAAAAEDGPVAVAELALRVEALDALLPLARP